MNTLKNLWAGAFLMTFFCLLSNAHLSAQDGGCCNELPYNINTFLAESNAQTVKRQFAADIFQWEDGTLLGAYDHWNLSTCWTDWCPARIETKTSQTGSVWPATGDVIFAPSDFPPVPAVFPNVGNFVAFAIENPSFIEFNNTLMLFFFVKYRNGCGPSNLYNTSQSCNYMNKIFVSTIPINNGDPYDENDWGPAVEVNTIFGYNIMNNARPLLLSNGTIVLPVAVSSRIQDAETLTTHYFKSYLVYGPTPTNLGWQISNTVSTTLPNLKRGFMEPGVVEVVSATTRAREVMMVMRAKDNNLWYSKINSNNLGGSWSSQTGTEFPPAGNFPNVAEDTPATLHRIPCTNDILMVFNEEDAPPSTPPTGREKWRNHLVAMISTDEGESWGQKIFLEGDPNNNWNWSYPSIDFVEDHVHLTYYEKDMTTGYISSIFRAKPLEDFYDVGCIYEEKRNEFAEMNGFSIRTVDPQVLTLDVPPTAEGNWQIQVLDLRGSRMWQRSIPESPVPQELTVPMHRWAKGLYLVRAFNVSTQESWRSKFLLR